MECEGLLLEGVKKAIMMKSWKKEYSATTPLSRVCGAKLLGKAETLMQESDWCNLICEPPLPEEGCLSTQKSQGEPKTGLITNWYCGRNQH